MSIPFTITFYLKGKSDFTVSTNGTFTANLYKNYNATYQVIVSSKFDQCVANSTKIKGRDEQEEFISTCFDKTLSVHIVKEESDAWIIIVIVAAAVAIVGSGFGYYFYRRKQRRHATSSQDQSEPLLSTQIN